MHFRSGDTPLRAPPGGTPSRGDSGIVRVMSGLAPAHPSSKPGQWVAQPLDASELAEAERVAARLFAEFGRLIEGLPPHARGASAMSRHLQVLRVTCQRVVGTVQSGPPSASMLVKLPGIEGLRQILEGFRRAAAPPEDVDAAQSAVDAFERLLDTTGGSQSRFGERLSLGFGRAGADEAGLATESDRDALINCAARITGRLCDVSLSIYAFRIAPDDPASLERALAKGLIGSVVTPGGLPMILSSGDTVHQEEEARRVMLLGGATARGRTPEAILAPFSTDPLPMVTSRSKGGTLFQIIDPSADAARRPIDVVTALRARHPLMDPDTGKPTLDAVWSLVNCPSRKLLLDVYLHVEMERLYRPSIEALQWAPSLDIPEDDRWVMRFPAQPRLHLLGRGMAGASSDFYPRHADLTRYFFDHIGWDPDEFLGFRCEVRAPIWRAGYCMGFEYLGNDRGAAPAANH